MAIKIIEDQEDVYLTRDELMRLREEYERGVSFMVNPPSFGGVGFAARPGAAERTCIVTTAPNFRGTAAEITKRLFPLPRPRKPGPKARRNQRLAIAAAQREVLHACIADSREVVADGPVRVTRLHLTEEGSAALTSKATGQLPGITGGSS